MIARFFLMIPDPTLLSPPPDRPTDPQALARTKQLTSMQADEMLSDDTGGTIDIQFMYEAPDKSAHTTSSGYRSVSVGNIQYHQDRAASGHKVSGRPWRFRLTSPPTTSKPLGRRWISRRRSMARTARSSPLASLAASSDTPGESGPRRTSGVRPWWRATIIRLYGHPLLYGYMVTHFYMVIWSPTLPASISRSRSPRPPASPLHPALPRRPEACSPRG